jgi:protein SCO1/2
VAAAALCLVVAPSQADARPRRAPEARPQATLPIFGEVPPFSFVDQESRPVGNADLRGHPWVADFIFTQCKTACPILSARMAMLQRAVADPDVRFVSFSVDPAHDTPEALKAYAARWRKDPRWRLLATGKGTLKVLVGRLVGVTVKETGDPEDPIIHTNGFLLVDRNGFVRGTYSAEDPTRLEQLERDLRILLAKPAAVKRSAAAPQGEQLFAELGCGGCHGDPHVAAPLGGLFGRMIKLADERVVKADDAFLRESITSPGSKIAAGYGATMPSYDLSPAQVDALVAYLKALPAPETRAPPRQLVVDPVCQMELSASEDTRHAEHDKKTYYFCSDACRAKFISDPARYRR